MLDTEHILVAGSFVGIKESVSFAILNNLNIHRWPAVVLTVVLLVFVLV